MVFFLRFPISGPAESSGVVVVVTEVGHVVKFVRIKIFAPLVVVVSQIVHIFLVEESISDPEEERIVETGI